MGSVSSFFLLLLSLLSLILPEVSSVACCSALFDHRNEMKLDTVVCVRGSTHCEHHRSERKCICVAEESNEHNVVDYVVGGGGSARQKWESEYDYYALSNMYSSTTCNARLPSISPASLYVMQKATHTKRAHPLKCHEKTKKS